VPLIRGHHLICLYFFNGDGYDEDFIENLRVTLRRAEGEPVRVSSGADDICKSCLHLRGGRCEQLDGAERVIQRMDRKALELMGLSVGERVWWDRLRGEIEDVFPQWYSLYCSDCDWRGACMKSSFYRKLMETR
jgi:hypothetical protein